MEPVGDADLRIAKIVELRGRYFTQPWPADTIVEVSALGMPELLIEIEATALAAGDLIG